MKKMGDPDNSTIEELRKLTPQTAYALHAEMEASKKERAESEERMAVLAKEIKAESRAGYFEMLKEVKNSVADLGQVITLQFDKFRLEIKGNIDNHENRITELEQQEETTNGRLVSLETKTRDIEELKNRLNKLNDVVNTADLSKTIPDFRARLEKVEGESGERAKTTLSAWKVAIIGAAAAMVVAGCIGWGKNILQFLKII
jgi:hypothetical protein